MSDDTGDDVTPIRVDNPALAAEVKLMMRAFLILQEWVPKLESAPTGQARVDAADIVSGAFGEARTRMERIGELLRTVEAFGEDGAELWREILEGQRKSLDAYAAKVEALREVYAGSPGKVPEA